MIRYCQHNLSELKNIIRVLTDEQYTCKTNILSDATIGQHIRHILEFYICLIEGIQIQKINYDNRTRNMNIESSVNYALSIIHQIENELIDLNKNAVIKLNGNYSAEENKIIAVSTTVERELIYCLEHSIHHQALIKIGLMYHGLHHLLPENFGVAPATIRYKKQCVQ